MGTMLRCSGSGPTQVLRIHREYVDAGAEIIFTNTFRPDREDHVRHMVALARQALGRCSLGEGGRDAVVAGDLGPGGDYEARATWLLDAGVDCIAIETMTDLDDALAALGAVRRVDESLPVIAMMTFAREGRTRTGVTAGDAARALADAGATVVGANCSFGPADMLPVIADMRGAVDVPIAAKPSAGLPSVIDGLLTYPVDALSFARYAVLLRDAGAQLLGGCCGTTPEYTAMMAKALR
jgi:methionine synthase I (cobalamin-dependent)